MTQQDSNSTTPSTAATAPAENPQQLEKNGGAYATVRDAAPLEKQSAERAGGRLANAANDLADLHR
jgi:hypothetical protein